MFSHLSLSNSKYWVIQSARASLRVQARAQRPRWAYIYKALEGLYISVSTQSLEQYTASVSQLSFRLGGVNISLAVHFQL